YFFLSQSLVDPRYLHSFPTRRSSDLESDDADLVLLDLTMPGASGLSGVVALKGLHTSLPIIVVSAHDDAVTIRRALELGAAGFRSEEHTSELQSRENLVCRLLLEKKN